MTQQIIAWAVLVFLWVFGGPVFFSNPHTKYKNVLAGWLVLNGVVIAVTAIVYVVFWALGVIFS